MTSYIRVPSWCDFGFVLFELHMLWDTDAELIDTYRRLQFLRLISPTLQDYGIRLADQSDAVAPFRSAARPPDRLRIP